MSILLLGCAAFNRLRNTDAIVLELVASIVGNLLLAEFTFLLGLTF